MNKASQARGQEKPLKLSQSEFEELSEILRHHAGLNFSPDKRREFEHKLSTKLSTLSGATGRDIIKLVSEFDDALQEIVNCLTIGEGYFFRNQPHFEALKERIFPQLMEQNEDEKRLRIWCAGCAKGEEPYSLAILIREHFPLLSKWKVTITATDINTEFLEKAMKGSYTKWSFRQIDDYLVKKYFIKEGENKYQLRDEIMKSVRFERFNLADLPYSGRLPEEAFDLILCRNVLIYFSFELANKVIDSFADVTHPGSFLLVGHSEAFPSLSRLDAIYSHATYYYRYHEVPGEQADRQSIAPGPRYSIPGIGVKTAVPFCPYEQVEEKSRPKARVESPKKPEPEREFVRAKRSKNIETELDNARKLMNHGKAEQAFAMLTELSSGRGELDFRLHFLRSIVADQLGLTAEATKSLKQAIFLKKNLVIAHFLLGIISQREDRIKTAKRSFRNAYNLVANADPHLLLEETDGVSAGRLKEILMARLKEIELEELDT